jgi:hypothetical protein
MKYKIFIVPIVLLIVFLFFFSGQYVYVGETEIDVVASPEGNPTLILEDEAYYVRYWQLAPGCYKLTKFALLDYRYAAQADESRCPVQAKSK